MPSSPTALWLQEDPATIFWRDAREHGSKPSSMLTMIQWGGGVPGDTPPSCQTITPRFSKAGTYAPGIFPVVGGFSTTTKATIMSESRCKSGWTVAVKPPGPTAFTVDTTLSSRKHSVGVNDP